MSYHERDTRARPWDTDELAHAQEIAKRRRSLHQSMRRRGTDCDILKERAQIIAFWKACAVTNRGYLPHNGAWWSPFTSGIQWRSLLMPKLRKLLEVRASAREAAYRAELERGMVKMRQRKADVLAAKARAASTQLELLQ